MFTFNCWAQPIFIWSYVITSMNVSKYGLCFAALIGTGCIVSWNYSLRIQTNYMNRNMYTYMFMLRKKHDIYIKSYLLLHITNIPKKHKELNSYLLITILV